MKTLSWVRKNFKLYEKKIKLCKKNILICVWERFSVECCAGKSYPSPLGKTEDQGSYPTKEIRAIPRIDKSTSTLFRYQKTAPVGACHDVGHMSYDNHLYNRTRLNQSIESLSRNRKEPRVLLSFTQNSPKILILVKKFSKVSFCSQCSFVYKQYKSISGIEQTFILHTHPESSDLDSNFCCVRVIDRSPMEAEI